MPYLRRAVLVHHQAKNSREALFLSTKRQPLYNCHCLSADRQTRSAATKQSRKTRNSDAYGLLLLWASFTPAGFARNDLSAGRQASVVVHFTFESDRTIEGTAQLRSPAGKSRSYSSASQYHATFGQNAQKLPFLSSPRYQSFQSAKSIKWP